MPSGGRQPQPPSVEEQPQLVHANVTLVVDEDVAEHPPPRWEARKYGL